MQRSETGGTGGKPGNQKDSLESKAVQAMGG
jgi:hypothetical protein